MAAFTERRMVERRDSPDVDDWEGRGRGGNGEGKLFLYFLIHFLYYSKLHLVTVGGFPTRPTGHSYQWALNCEQWHE